MKNILTIFRRDVKRCYKNVIALIVVLGVTVVPSLYAWFNIAASWDPYENTGNLKVAVASVDQGYEGELVSISMNLGDNVLSALRENSQLDWTFTSKKKAVNGVKSGKYYAAIVIPKDFSKNMMSLFSSQVTNPKIAYYSNAKENAIAPKVTDKGASAIQTQVKEVFIKTITDTALAAMQAVARTTDKADAQNVAEALIGNLGKTSAELNAASGTIQAFSALTSSTQKMLDTTSGFLGQSRKRSKDSMGELKQNQGTLSDMQTAITGVTDGISQALEAGQGYYDKMGQFIEDKLSSLSNDTAAQADALEELAGKTGDSIKAAEDMRDALKSLGEQHPETAPLMGGALEGLNDSIKAQKELQDKLSKAADSVRNQSPIEADSIEELKNLLDQNRQKQGAVKADYEEHVKKSLSSLYDSVDYTKSSISDLLGRLDESASSIQNLSGTASADLSQVKQTLDTSGRLLDEAAQRLSATVGQLKAAKESGDFAELEKITKGDKESISTFLSAPVELKTTKLYPIDNYGSSMAPFYSTLAIWVGGIVLVAMLKVTVSQDSLKGMKNVKDCHTYLGRYIMFFIIGLMQSGLICLGDLYYLGIQCRHPFLYLAAGWITGIVYVNIIYTLTVSFGDIGKAVCVVLLVMQVAGSGGTFPIEVAPNFFQKVYPLLPFTHSMAAMRECIGGFYGKTYFKELGMLGIFLGVSLILGLVLRRPIIRLNEAFTEKLESTHLM